MKNSVEAIFRRWVHLGSNAHFLINKVPKNRRWWFKPHFLDLGIEVSSAARESLTFLLMLNSKVRLKHKITHLRVNLRSLSQPNLHSLSDCLQMFGINGRNIAGILSIFVKLQ